MSYKAVLFDLDGTILNTLNDLANATNVTLRAFQMPERSIGEVRQFVGNGIRRLIERAAPTDTSTERIDAMFSFFLSYYKEHCADQTQPYPGVHAVIRSLRERGLRTAVISNKADTAVKSLCADYFPNLFDLAIGERAGQRRKPYPDSVLETIRALSLSREDVIYVGDSEVDVQTAQNAEIDAVLVSWGFRDEAFLYEMGARRVIHTPEELLSIVLPDSQK